MAFHVRCECTSDPRHGCAPRERALPDYLRRGVVVLDKPPGCTSRRAADRVRQALGGTRVGHGGTLDPGVTGVLPVLLDEATPAAAVLLGCDKAYEGAMQLHGDVPDGELAAAMDGLCGVIVQRPPRRSRVRRVPRERAVRAFTVTERAGRSVVFAVRCQGGTYVRTLVHDLGQALGTGAHMAALRRTQAGPFGLHEAVKHEQVERAVAQARAGDEAPLRSLVHPVDEVVCRVLPRLSMDDGAVDAVCCGVPLAVPGVCGFDDFLAGEAVALMTLKGELVGVGRARADSESLAAAQRGVAATPRRVFLARGTYPSHGGAGGAS